jgi:hypothetical protein
VPWQAAGGVHEAVSAKSERPPTVISIIFSPFSSHGYGTGKRGEEKERKKGRSRNTREEERGSRGGENRRGVREMGVPDSI